MQDITIDHLNLNKAADTATVWRLWKRFVVALFAGALLKMIYSSLFDDTVFAPAIPFIFVIGYAIYLVMEYAKTINESQAKNLKIIVAAFTSLKEKHEELVELYSMQDSCLKKSQSDISLLNSRLSRALSEKEESEQKFKSLLKANEELSLQNSSLSKQLDNEKDRFDKMKQQAIDKFADKYRDGRLDEKELQRLVRSIPQISASGKEVDEALLRRKEELEAFHVGKGGGND